MFSHTHLHVCVQCVYVHAGETRVLHDNLPWLHRYAPAVGGLAGRRVDQVQAAKRPDAARLPGEGAQRLGGTFWSY